MPRLLKPLHRLITTALLLLLLVGFSEAQDKQAGPRRPLPKPPNASRGFEQSSRKDASSRLIAAGATRGPLKPIAPFEGLAYDARPFFSWTPSPGANSYHFTLRDGTDSSAKIIYESDTKDAQLRYPTDATALTPGHLYLWRVSIAGVMERKLGQPASFYILADEDAREVRKALERAKLAAPKTVDERLRQAQIFEQYGIWYDALRIASELVTENPANAAAKSYYDSLIQKLRGEESKAAEQSSSRTLPLWQKLEPLLAAKNEQSARALIDSNRDASRALYRELLFESVSNRLYENPPLPFAEQARVLLAQSDSETAALEAKFTEWAKEQKPGVGFTAASSGVEQLLYTTIVAHLRAKEKDAGKDAPKGTPRELTERALAQAESIGNELGIAALSANLSVYALREKRLDDVLPLIERSQVIWKEWNHPVGIFQAALVKAYASFTAENWKEAAQGFTQAAELARVLPALRSERVNSLSMLATTLRNLNDKEGTHAALATAVEEEQQVLKEASGEDARLKESNNLADLETQMGGAIAALGRHREAGEWYAHAELLKQENSKLERAHLESQIVEYTTTLQARIKTAESEEQRKTLRKLLETITDTILMQLDTLASRNKDRAMTVKIAERRLALAREGGDPDHIATALENLANAERKADDLAKARATAEEALRLRQSDPRRIKLYETLYLLGDIAYYEEDWNEAVNKYKEVIEVTKPGALPALFDLDAEPDKEIRRTRARMNREDLLARESRSLDARAAIGYIFMQQGNYSEAGRMLEEVSQAIPRLYAIGAQDERELLKWIEESKNANLNSVDIAAHRRQTGFTPDKDEEQRINFAELMIRTHRAVIVNHRALLYESENDLDKAVKAYEQAYNMFANEVGGSFTLSGTYVSLARIERERGNYAAAEAPVAAALAEFERNHEAWGIANMLSFQSMLRRDEGRLEESRKLAEDALLIARQLSTRSQLAAILRTLGRTESEIGGDALKASEQHLRESLNIWRELSLRAHVAYTLDSLGQTLERMNRDDEALAAYIEAVRIVETLTGSLSQDVNAETFNAARGNRDLYDHLIKLLIKKGRTGEALQYLERAKSKVLVDALAGANVKAKDAAITNLLERVRQQSDALRIAEKELTAELAKPETLRDADKIAAARTKLANAQGGYLEAVEQIKRANPSYASLVAVNPTNLVEVRKRLPEKTALLEYFPTDNELYIFVVTRDDQPTVHSVPIGRASLAKLVMQYREALESASEPSVLERSTRGTLWKDDGTEDFKRYILPIKDATVKLYDALIAPVQAEVDKSDTLLIVPAAELYYLPIHALGRIKDDGSLSFLIEQKRFAYLASADLINAVAATKTDTTNQARTTGSPKLLALGNPDGSLPAASEEMAALSRLLTGSRVFTGGAATISRLTLQAEHPSYLHFATHGIINSLDPKESYLLLAGQPDHLSVKDIVENNYKISFDGTELVTLSACETNIGGYDPSAVYSSLSRAFSKAGAPTVIASLWSVSDLSTRETMIAFYKELAAGRSKAEAMRRAQISVMRDARFAHPFYWAPFVVLGEWQ